MHLAINAYFWNQPFVGSGQYTRNLVYYLNRLVSDLEITLIYPQTPEQPEPEAVPPSVQVKKVPVRSGQLGKVLFEQWQFPRACAEVGATIAHVPYWGAPLQSPVPLVVTIHDLTTLLVPEYRRGWKSRLYNALVTASARGASHVITDSFASKINIIDLLGIEESGVTAVYLAVGPEYTPKAGNSLLETAVRRKYDLPDFYILYLGGFLLHKNINTLLLAYSYVGPSLGTDYPLILAGRKPSQISDIYPDYDAYIKALGIEKYVKWIGFVDEEDKPILYRNAETFVFPSRNEGFGLDVLEALACGVPVVTTTADSLPEVIGDAGFAVDPDDARAMAGAIIATVLQDNLRADLQQKAAQQVALFSWEKTATETLMIYDYVTAKA
jgi:glycosyltransferase involved in cell wall biosynthesis